MALPAIHAQEMRAANHVFITAHYDRLRLIIDVIGVSGFLVVARAELSAERTSALRY